MKLSLNIFQKFMLAFCLGMFFVGCSNDNLQEEQQSQTETHNIEARGEEPITAADMEFVGIRHNEYLKIIYNDLSTTGFSGQEGIEFVRNFLTDKIYNTPGPDEYHQFSVQLIDEALVPGNPYMEKGNFYPNAEVADYLGAEEKYYLDILYSIVTGELPLEERKNQIIDLENEIKLQDFSNKQLRILYSATNTAKYSLTYWNANFHKWDMLDGRQEAAKLSFWEATGGADVGAAVGSAVGCAVVNLVPVWGQVAYGSTIVSATVAGSVGAAITYGLYEWWD